MDKDFLKKLDLDHDKVIYVKLVVLDKEEQPISSIEGRVSQGSISITGTSAVRRTCNLTFLAEETENVEILHLPLTDSVREAVETTAAATEISKDDIIVEPVQDENIDVKSESVGFTVTGLSLIALAAPKKAPTSPLKAPATGTISGEVRLFEKDGTTPLNNQDVINTGFEPYKGHGVLVYIKNKDGDKSVAGWQIVDITKHANYSAVTPFEFDAANFHVFKNEGKEYDAETVAFDPEKHDVVFRLYNTWSNVSGCNFYDIISVC